MALFLTPEMVKARLVDFQASDDLQDNEAAHIQEDEIHRTVLAAIAADQCSDPVTCAALALTTTARTFSRWYA